MIHALLSRSGGSFVSQMTLRILLFLELPISLDVVMVMNQILISWSRLMLFRKKVISQQQLRIGGLLSVVGKTVMLVEQKLGSVSSMVFLRQWDWARTWTKVQEWQRLPYVGPYGGIREKRKSKAAIMALEKWAVAIVHEFLSLTMEKMVEVEKIRDLFLDHPGIFYLSTKEKTHTVFLREDYERGWPQSCLWGKEKAP